MKTLTELSGSLIRVAAAAVAEAKRSLPSEAKPAVPAPRGAAPAPAEAEAASADTTATADSTEGAEPGSVEAVEAPQPTEAAVERRGQRGPRRGGRRRPRDSRAIGSRCSVPRSRWSGGAPRMSAWSACSARRSRSRRIAVGGHQYLVDFLPQSMKQVAGGPKDDRGGRRGGRAAVAAVVEAVVEVAEVAAAAAASRRAPPAGSR